MIKLNSVVFIVTFLSVFGICHNYKHSYTAAVVDYVHAYGDTPKESLAANAEEYIKLINVAARKLSKIIVFPEYGLVDIYEMNIASREEPGLDAYSTFVPDPERHVIPCHDTKMEKYAMHLINISCAARDDEIYTVFNLLEKSTNNATGKLDFHNTNVVLDRKGTVIARYRKIQLSEEPFLTAGNTLVTFETDFGVTFGIFTCFDILFQYPALEVLTLPNVTDIIFPTAWYSESPFLQALSIQHGYCKANGVNLLGSCLQDPGNYDGGSGIFLANGTIAGLVISAKRVTEMVISAVPIIKNRATINECKYSTPTIGDKERDKHIKKENEARHTAQLNNIDNFTIHPENLTDYTFKRLQPGLMGICTTQKDFCCTFNTDIDNSSISKPDYIYKLAIFNGLSIYGSTILGGVRACALVACLNESDSTCGQKVNSSLTSTRFRSIHLKATVVKSNETYNQPATLRHDLTPVSDYTYCEIESKDRKQTTIVMATTAPQELLLTFGIYGRVYSNDEVVGPKPPPKRVELDYTLIIMIVSFSVIILICTGGLMYKFCMKED